VPIDALRRAERGPERAPPDVYFALRSMVLRRLGDLARLHEAKKVTSDLP
jgi:hypothetical protein